MPTRFTESVESMARTTALALVVALVATVGLWYALQRGTERTITAYFTNTVGLYVDNTVDVQGIPVGQVEDIVPQGNLVQVVLRVDNDVAVAADAQAMIVAPSLVSDRYVQLGPSWTGGPLMADGAVIPASRTGTPVELDRVYQSLDAVAQALGPNGADRTGALNQLLRSSAGALGGNGELLKSTITQLGAAVGTLSDNRGDLFASLNDVGRLTGTLAQGDGQVRALATQLSDVSAFLSAERGNLSGVLATLPPALEDVARFVRDNREVVGTDVAKLHAITDVLDRQRGALAELGDVAPLALGNLTNTYDAASGTVDVRPVTAPGLDPRALLCGLLDSGGLPRALGALPAAGPAGAVGAQAARAQTVCAALTPAAGSLSGALAPFAQVQRALAARGDAAARQAVAAANAAQLVPAGPGLPASAPTPFGAPYPGPASGPAFGPAFGPAYGPAPADPGAQPVAPGAGILGLGQVFGSGS